MDIVLAQAVEIASGGDSRDAWPASVPKDWRACHVPVVPGAWVRSAPARCGDAMDAARSGAHARIAGTAWRPPPASIYLNQDGTRTADQQAGKALFEGMANCTQCHAGPTFIPPPGSPRTIAAGIGTGLAPIDVRSLRGAWATAPYLHDGSATTLMDVLTINPSDAHWQAAAPLTDNQRRQRVEYEKTL